MPPLPADFIHAQALQTNLRKTLDTTVKPGERQPEAFWCV